MKATPFRVLVPLVMAGLLVACGGDGSIEETTTEAASDTTAAPVATDDDDDGGLPGESCLEANEAMAAAVSSYSDAFTGALDEETAGQIEEQLQAMAAAAPEEIRDDFEMYARELGDFYRVLAEIGLTPGATPTAEQLQALSEAADQVDQEAFDEATANISAWYQANC